MEPKGKSPGVGPCPCSKPEKGLTLCLIKAKCCGDDDNKFIECTEYAIILEGDVEEGCEKCRRVKSRNDMNWYDLPVPDDVWQSLKKMPLCPMCKKEANRK